MQDSKRGEKGGTYQINVREYRRAIEKDNPVKLATYGTQDEETK
jgi:hypothetical protein